MDRGQFSHRSGKHIRGEQITVVTRENAVPAHQHGDNGRRRPRDRSAPDNRAILLAQADGFAGAEHDQQAVADRQRRPRCHITALPCERAVTEVYGGYLQCTPDEI